MPRLKPDAAKPPPMAHHDAEIGAAYDWTAEQEVQTSPRKFRFLQTALTTNAYYQLSRTDTDKYLDGLTSLAKGEGRLWIADSRVTHSHGVAGRENVSIEWMKFTVELKLLPSK